MEDESRAVALDREHHEIDDRIAGFAAGTTDDRTHRQAGLVASGRARHHA